MVSNHLKRQVFVTSVLLSILVVCFIGLYFQNKNFNAQIYKLTYGTAQEKGEALEFIGKNKLYDKIPEVMKYIESRDSYLYLGKDPTPLTCDATLALEKLTLLPNGNTCDSSNSKTDEEKTKTIRDWKNWYVNEYPQWIKSK